MVSAYQDIYVKPYYVTTAVIRALNFEEVKKKSVIDARFDFFFFSIKFTCRAKIQSEIKRKKISKRNKSKFSR